MITGPIIIATGFDPVALAENAEKVLDFSHVPSLEISYDALVLKVLLLEQRIADLENAKCQT